MNPHILPTARRLAAAGFLLFHGASFAGIVAYWRFEDISGPSAAEHTGRFTGELTGFDYLDPGSGDSGPTMEGWSTNVAASVVPQTGQPNNGSIRMGGASAYVDFSNGQDMSLGKNFTIEFFMKPDTPVGGSPTFGLSPFNGLSSSLIIDGGSLAWWNQFQDEFSLAPTSSVQIGIWQHFALVKTPGEYSIYINGMLDFNASLPPDTDGPYWFPGTDWPGDRTIGGDSGTFRGWLDEFRISDEALTPDRFLCSVPEPSTITLLIMGCLGMYGRRRWKRT